MFFKKKKKVKNQSQHDQPKKNKQQLTEEIDWQLAKLEKADGNERIEVLNKLGSLYFELHEFDKAIEYYETSISENKTLGKAFTDLTKLYNIKRKEATVENDKEKVQGYLQKSDELMKLTKDSIRGRV
ncbi:tetratricopeptide repeat protein [Gracilibacillus sp. YIM 98692]|uniref:tetratricopeptide repeat protein n=1 Tax=Gracilibacillus sp. YIM 98692 TaxID=2663532 RepID=UPI0013D61D9A|nr:tetratricopeptide repeat protein [Gracilibacillus sp. YIM 98692]